MSNIQPKIGDQWTMNATMLQTHKLEKQKNLVGDPTVIVSNAKGTSRKRKFECVVLGARVKGSTTVNPTIEFYAHDAATYGFVAAPAAPVAPVEGGPSETAEPAPKRPRAAAEPSDSAAVAPEHPHVGLKLPGGFVVEGTTVRGGSEELCGSDEAGVGDLISRKMNLSIVDSAALACARAVVETHRYLKTNSGASG